MPTHLAPGLTNPQSLLFWEVGIIALTAGSQLVHGALLMIEIARFPLGIPGNQVVFTSQRTSQPPRYLKVDSDSVLKGHLSPGSSQIVGERVGIFLFMHQTCLELLVHTTQR